MKKFNRLSLILIICLVAICILNACGGLRDKIFDFKNYEDFKKSTKNYSMTINDNGDITTIKVCEDGYLFDNGSELYFYNALEKKGYLLNKDSKTGVVNTYESGETLYDWEENGGMIDLLYSFQFLKLLMKKDGTDKIAGRNCTVYSYSADGVSSKFWLDNEFGMCLKSETTEEGKKKTMEVTEFILGDVTLANMIDLSVYTIDDIIVPAKAVKSITVKTETIPTGKTVANFILSDIKITVVYEDDSTEEISIARSMLSAMDKNKLESAGTHTVTVTFGDKTAVFTVTLTGSSQTSSPIPNSIKNFYSNIANDLNASKKGFIPNLALNIASNNPYFKDYYYESIESRADMDMWSAPNLLLDASFKIEAYLEDAFITEEVDFGGGIKKTTSCAATSEGYSIKYTEKKGLYTYWFETDISYDLDTESLKAEIFCGVDAQQELKYIIEYNKNTDNNYACLIHYPDEPVEGNPQSYSSLNLYFNSVSGKAGLNRLQENAPAQSFQLYKKADNADYADNGDAVISTDGTTVTCTVDNLKSGFCDDFNALLAAITANRESIFNAASEAEKDIYYGNDSESLIYAFEYINVGDNSINDIVKTYDNKRLLEKGEGVRININHSGDTYVMTYELNDEEIVLTMKYDKSGSFYVFKEVNGEMVLRFQWIKIGTAHFVEVLSNDYGTYMQYKYTFDTAQNTMKFVYIYEIGETIDLNIYKVAELTAATFTPEPDANLYPFYRHYSFASSALGYKFSMGEK